MPINFSRNVQFLLHGGEAVRDESFYHVPLSTQGSVPAQDDAAAFGGKALAFTGNSANYLRFEDPFQVAGNLPAGPFYLYARVKFSGTTSASQAIVGRAAASGNQAWYLMVNGALTTVTFWSTPAGTATGGTQLVSGAFAFNTTDYYQIEVSRDAANLIRVFVDGTLVASATFAVVYSSTTQQTTIGRIGVSGFEFPLNGLIDELAIVTGESVEESAHAVRTGPFDNPVLSAGALGAFVGRVLGAATPGAVSVDRAGREPGAIDLTHGGVHQLSGHVAVDDTPTDMPVARRVLLLDERDNRVIRQTWSRASDGYYLFAGIAGGRRYSVIAYDYPNNYRAVIADNRLPEPMA